MKPLFIFLLAFFVPVFFFSLASAVEVDIPQDYHHGDRLTIPVTGCNGLSTVRITAPDNELTHVDQGTGDWSSLYHTNSHPSDGKYVLIVNCADGTAAELTFCVDAAGCNAVERPGGPSGGELSCTSRWSCAAWSYCDSELKQTRTCYDRNQCQERKEQTRICSECEESWVCTPWSACQDGRQERACLDEHLCGTRIAKPVLQKLCAVSLPPGPQPSRVAPQLPVIAARWPATPVPSLGLRKVWEVYKVPIVAIPLTVMVLAVLVSVIIHFTRRGPKKSYNFDELKEWIKKEKEMGSSLKEIIDILKQNTGWKKKEVLEAFEELKEGK